VATPGKIAKPLFSPPLADLPSFFERSSAYILRVDVTHQPSSFVIYLHGKAPTFGWEEVGIIS
jgi:hypothetical protein